MITEEKLKRFAEVPRMNNELNASPRELLSYTLALNMFMDSVVMKELMGFILLGFFSLFFVKCQDSPTPPKQGHLYTCLVL